ncbi:MAG: hypothetical protein AVDCRST_MAG59-992 [uncultured Thermomicrobiales bacterium]|uniref:Uncharacterized protein n=1 Tax=uncultured Thermomicrobiales bacterium TaxID=1645740 RepID=A0A6J4U7V8_9BACT|nr:MAG: hypothetical protein AVDCRST_MAG59-992 [uncultured Thermomicrobiales bacterium]
METTTFDRTVKTLAADLSRRGVLRGVAAGLVAAATGTMAVADAPARKKRRCRPGKSIAFITVPATGALVFTPVLRKGQTYVLHATGFWATDGTFFNDAFARFAAKNPGQPILFDQGVRLGLAVDGLPPDLWGTYKTSHAYGMAVVGRGRALSLQFLDSAYGDNSRLLNVEVVCGR